MLLGEMIENVSLMPLQPMVVYCGSTSKCRRQFQRVALYDTIRDEPRIFMTIGCNVLSDEQLIQSGIVLDKQRLDLLHFQKIQIMAYTCQAHNLAGEVCILDLTDTGEKYIGPSTRNEEYYAKYLISLGYPLTLRYWSKEQEEVRKVLRDLKIG